MIALDIISKLFPEDIIRLGKKLFQEGKFEIDYLGRKSITLSFQQEGQTVTSIELEKLNGSISFDCDCEEYHKIGYCEHVWAGLLAAEVQGVFGYSHEEMAQGDSIASEYEFQKGEFFDSKVAFKLPKINSKELALLLDEELLSNRGRWRFRILERHIFDDGRKSRYFKASIERYRTQGHLESDARFIQYLSKDFYNTHYESVEVRTIKDAENILYSFGDRIFKKQGPENQLTQLELDLSSIKKPAHFCLEVTSSRGVYQAFPRLVSPKNRYPGREVEYAAGPLVKIDKLLVVSDVDQYKSWVPDLNKEAIKIGSLQQVQIFLTSIYNTETVPVLDLPEELKYQNRKGLQKTRVVLKKVKGSKRLSASIEFLYGKAFVSGADSGEYVLDHEEKIKFQRNKRMELMQVKEFLKIVELKKIKPDGVVWISDRKLNTTVERAFKNGWEVILFNKKLSPSKEFKISAKSSGIDWFELKANLKFANGLDVSLSSFLKAVEQGKNYVNLADGTRGFLNETLLKKYKYLPKNISFKNGQVMMSKVQAIYASAELTADAGFTSGKKFSTVNKIISKAQRPPKTIFSKKFNGKLDPYQHEAVDWLGYMASENLGTLLAYEMGLGKTVITIAHLASALKQKALIVMPKSILYNWQAEFAKFAPHIKVHLHYGGDRSDRLAEFQDANVILTTYHTVMRDVESLSQMNFEYLVLDEAQNIKNPQSDMHKACRLIQAKKKIALTGTPLENSVGDVFSIFNIINPGLFSKAAIEKFVAESDEQVASKVQRAISPFIRRKKKDEVRQSLPPKTEKIVYCKLDSRHSREYEHNKRLIWAKVQTGGPKEMLKGLTALRQLAFHPGIKDPSFENETSSKITMLMDHLARILPKGNKVLVFSTYTGFLRMMTPALEAEGYVFDYIDGKTSANQRRDIIKNFQENELTQILLITTGTGGVGLNLTAASHTFILDPWWNPAREAQAIDRIHRIGQTKNVTAYKLISKGTVEEKVLELQRKKKWLADAVIDGSFKGSKLTIEDLRSLYD